MFNKRIQKQIKNISNKIYKSTRRDILVYGEPESFNCPNCYFDTSTGKSSGVFKEDFTEDVEVNGEVISPVSFTRGRCPVCKGSGSIEFNNKKVINCYVMWDPQGDDEGDLDFTSVGLEGSNAVLVKANQCFYSFIRDSVYAIIDGIKCVLLRPPTLRKVGRENLSVFCYFKSSEPGYSTRN